MGNQGNMGGGGDSIDIQQTNTFKFTTEMNWTWYLFFGIPK